MSIYNVSHKRDLLSVTFDPEMAEILCSLWFTLLRPLPYYCITLQPSKLLHVMSV